jgi:sugar lactone lactonase YvrE
MVPKGKAGRGTMSSPCKTSPEHTMTLSISSPWQALTREPDGLSESPFWHPHEQRLYWVDIPGCRLARVLVEGAQAKGPVEYWPLGQEPGCIAPVQGGGLVMALRDGIYLAREWGGPLQALAAAPYDTGRLRFNDGKCDPQGRFWAGSMYEPRDQALGVLYALQGHNVQVMAHGATTANGLAWSPDARTLYWADTAAHRVRAWDFDATSGAVTNERVFHQFASKPAGWVWGQPDPSAYGGRPDGAAVDAEGAYWSAQYEGQRLVRLSPQGEVLAEIDTPVPCPTMPCFGGPDLRTLFITTSRQGRSDAELARYPLAGCIFSTRLDVPGLPVNFYRPPAY